MRVQRLAELDVAAQQRLMQRSATDIQRVLPQVQAIMEDVRQRGDAAVREFSARFDRVVCEDFRVSTAEMEAAFQQVAPALLESLQHARANLEQRVAPGDERIVERELAARVPPHSERSLVQLQIML